MRPVGRGDLRNYFIKKFRMAVKSGKWESVVFVAGGDLAEPHPPPLAIRRNRRFSWPKCDLTEVAMRGVDPEISGKVAKLQKRKPIVFYWAEI